MEAERKERLGRWYVWVVSEYINCVSCGTGEFKTAAAVSYTHLDVYKRQLQELYGKKIAPFHLPIRENGQFVGYVNVLQQRAKRWKENGEVEKKMCIRDRLNTGYLGMYEVFRFSFFPRGVCCLKEEGVR